MTIPYWVQDAIIYQIFPDRFANGDPDNDPPTLQPWNSPPTLWGFQGGDLRGVIQKFDYLLDLGINTIYLNPIFLSPSTHRYNSSDYYLIEPRLGDMNDFRSLLDLAHSNQVRVILDGVFNHCSRSFFAFADLLENQEHSAYKDWFYIKQFPVDAFSPGEATSYAAWWGIKSLPKFNTRNPAVRQFLLSVACYWIEQGADGWRLDVPNEIDDDTFWAEFRHVVKGSNHDAYILGEIWTADPRWVGPDHFDGLINYPLRDLVIELLVGGTLTTNIFAERLEKLLKMYARENAYAMYNLLGSHDTERIRTKLGGDIDKVKLAHAIIFALPGAPAIYYGDEIGLSGGKDPENRGTFPWNPDDWQINLREWVQLLITVRKRQIVLRRGNFQPLMVDDRSHIFAFARTLGNQNVVVAINAGPVPRYARVPVNQLHWEDGRILHDLLQPKEYQVSGDTVTIHLPAWSIVYAGET
jgi:cyclomaltodextrinase